MALSAAKITAQNDSINVAKETFIFTARKLYSLLPYHLIAFVLTLAVKMYFREVGSAKATFLYLLKTLPNFFLLMYTGVDENRINGEEWYISCMLVCGFILFALLLKYKKTFSRIVCPVIGASLIGLMIHKTSDFSGVDTWIFNGFFSKAYVRAFADMSLGIFLYEVVDFLKKCNFTNKALRGLGTVLELAFYGICFLIIMLDAKTIEVYFVAFMMMALSISLSRTSFTATLFDNPVCCFLGKVSLPIYLCQRIVFVFFNKTNLLAGHRTRVIVLVVLGSIALVTAVVYWLAKPVKKLIDRFISGVFPEDIRIRILGK